ncbi:MAG: HEAT repeat domain-containing protein [Ruminiclostridium sp.]
MNLLAEDLLREYEELKKSGFELGKVFEFGGKLGRSNEFELHFRLILEDEKRPRSQRWHPEDFFRFHGYEGILYLRQLLTSKDKDCAVSAAYLMAELLPRGRYPGQAELLAELNKTLVRLAGSEMPEFRRKCLIAIGWVGTERELYVLEGHLLEDSDSLCRAWSASAFLQMSGRVDEDILKQKASPVLISCFEQETDVFVRGVAVEAVQAIWDVKLGLRSSAVEDRNQKAVNRGVRKALEFLNTERNV